MRRPNLPVWGIVGTQLLLCAGLAALWLTPELQLRNTTWQPPEVQKADIQSMVPQPPQTEALRQDDKQLLQMQERPLFSMTRRPPPPPPPPPPPAREPEPDRLANAQVLGSFAGKVTGIILRVDGKEQRLMMNQALNGWKLIRVDGRDVEFEREGNRRTLTIARSSMDKGPASRSGEPVRSGPSQADSASEAAPQFPLSPGLAKSGPGGPVPSFGSGGRVAPKPQK